MYVSTPRLQPNGELVWVITSDGCKAVVHEDGSREMAIDSASPVAESFLALVGAVAEWYKTDCAEYKGLNAQKVRSELGSQARIVSRYLSRA